MKTVVCIVWFQLHKLKLYMYFKSWIQIPSILFWHLKNSTAMNNGLITKISNSCNKSLTQNLNTVTVRANRQKAIWFLLGWPKKLVQVFLPGKPKWTFLANSIFRSSVDRMMPLTLVRASSLLLLPIDILITSRKHPHRLTQKWCFAKCLRTPGHTKLTTRGSNNCEMKRKKSNSHLLKIWKSIKSQESAQASSH